MPSIRSDDRCVCGKATKKVCDKCGVVGYCSAKCLEADRKSHKAVCKRPDDQPIEPPPIDRRVALGKIIKKQLSDVWLKTGVLDLFRTQISTMIVHVLTYITGDYQMKALTNGSDYITLVMIFDTKYPNSIAIRFTDDPIGIYQEAYVRDGFLYFIDDGCRISYGSEQYKGGKEGAYGVSISNLNSPIAYLIVDWFTGAYDRSCVRL